MNYIIPKFVEYIPDHLEEGIIYISLPFGVAVHKCCCGCSYKVITPLSDDWWTLTINGDLISLDPSIGNFQFPCKSHYSIKNNEIIWYR
jgi:hypothetical protein